MAIQSRLILTFLGVLAGALGFLWVSAAGLSRNVALSIDGDLDLVARTMLEEAGRSNPSDLRDFLPSAENSTIVRASTFYVLLTADGTVSHTSPDLQHLDKPLYPVLNDDDPTPYFNDTRFEGQNIRVLTYPIYLLRGEAEIHLGYLQIGRITNEIISYNRLSLAIVFMGVATLFVALAMLGVVIPRTLRPLTEIAQTAEQITLTNDLSVRVPESEAEDEIGNLSQVLNRLIERVDSLFKTQQQLLADVSHELRTPLTSILGNVDLMRRMGEGDPESLDAIETEAGRMSRLVNDLLSLARADVGGLPIRRELVDLDLIFLNVFEQINVIDSPVRIRLKEIEPVRVLGDPDRLTQLMLNLMTNAVKYTNVGGQVTVGLATDETTAIITVQDTGIGIPRSDLPRVFDRFYRVNKARSRERGGSGLGLSIAKSIATAHYGDIRVESEVGVGSTFTVTLPIYHSSN